MANRLCDKSNYLNIFFHPYFKLFVPILLVAGRSQRKKCLLAPKLSDILKVSWIQWGLEIRTRKSERHLKTKLFKVRFSNGSNHSKSKLMASLGCFIYKEQILFIRQVRTNTGCYQLTRYCCTKCEARKQELA